jgi:iron-sulfur cluster assembly accessory protein
MAIELSSSAAAEVKRYMEAEKIETGYVLRMGIAGGGCSGLQYSLGFANDYQPAVDARYEYDGVAVVTSKKMALHLDGTKVDFQDGPMGRGFTIDNPNVAKAGGCGSCGCH